MSSLINGLDQARSSSKGTSTITSFSGSMIVLFLFFGLPESGSRTRRRC